MEKSLTTREKIKEKLLYNSLRWIVVFLMMMGIAYMFKKKDYAFRDVVLSNPVKTWATVTKIRAARSCSATYEFKVKDSTFSGNTIGCYRGHVGDTICVMYHKIYPAYNLYCNNTKKENFRSDVLPGLLIFFVVILVLILVITPIKIWLKS